MTPTPSIYPPTTFQAVQPGIFPLKIELTDHSSLSGGGPSLSLPTTNQALSQWAARTNASVRFHDFEDHMNTPVDFEKSTASTGTGVDFLNRHIDASFQ